MSYHKHTTEAFVVASRESGEADYTFKLYTKNFGMIFALSKGVRHLKSKLKPHLILGSLVSISLVRGKEFYLIL